MRSFQDFSHYIDTEFYVGDLPNQSLDTFAAVVVADGIDSVTIARHKHQLNNYARNGGFLIVFCQGNADWVDVVSLKWQDINCKDWLWWTKPGQKLEIYQPSPLHPICSDIRLSAMSWHWGGTYELDSRSKSILSLENNQGSLFLDFPELDGGGRLMVSTLDPHSHNGQRFMPATTQFLMGFYPWLNRELSIERGNCDRVTYIQCMHTLDNYIPEHVERGLKKAGFKFRYCPQFELNADILAKTDILYLPTNHDEIFLKSIQSDLLAYLEGGGNMIICAEPFTAWLPFLSPFNAVPPRPFSNIKIRVQDDRPGFFKNMDDTFDGWDGIFGQYARGWSDMPNGAICLTELGTPADPKPADWLWRYPSQNGCGGYVFMHNGDNMIRYPDHGPHKGELVRDICIVMQSLSIAKQVL